MKLLLKLFTFRLSGLMADTRNTYTHAFYMSGAVVIAGACVPFLLLFTKVREPGYESRTTLLDRRHEDKRIEEITATMDLKQVKKTKSETGTQENFILNISTV